MKPVPPAKVAGLFVCHVRSERIERHFRRLVDQTGHMIDWHFMFNPGNRAEPQVDFAYRPPDSCMPARYREMAAHGGVQRGYLDVAIIPCVLSLDADFVWVIEYDVDYSGDWAQLFDQFSRNASDLLTTTIQPLAASRNWYYWQSAAMPASVSPDLVHRAFHPIMRLSRHFARTYGLIMSVAGWRGHYEFTLPTVALAGGFTVEDIGGQGPLCPPARRGTNYENTPQDECLRPGTLIWRPSCPRYFAEDPSGFSRSNMIHHPVKPDVADWDMPA
ncbi:hypothetical protein [Azospirillum palustre]